MIKKYTILSKIGQGAFGAIYKVTKNFKYFVIKEIFLKNESKELINQVENEAKLLEQLSNSINNSNYIVQYFESFIENSNFYIVMEYCDKGDLNDYIQKIKQKKTFIPENEIWKYFILISIALGILYKNKIIHRDLKPLNIFLTIKGRLKIGDFGISKCLKSKKFTDSVLGTIHYISPEICLNKPYNFKTDIWSLGVILYELCTLKHPFEGDSPYKISMEIIKGEYEKINSNKNIVKYSKSLEDMISKILNINSKRRPDIFDILSDNIVLKKAINLNLIEEIKNLFPEVLSKNHIFPQLIRNCNKSQDKKKVNNKKKNIIQKKKNNICVKKENEKEYNIYNNVKKNKINDEDLEKIKNNDKTPKDDLFSSIYENKNDINYFSDKTINQNFENELKKILDERTIKENQIKKKLNKNDFDNIMNFYGKSFLNDNEKEFNNNLNQYMEKNNFSEEIKYNTIILFVELLSIDTYLKNFIK